MILRKALKPKKKLCSDNSANLKILNTIGETVEKVQKWQFLQFRV